ncbi:hypothetical protein N0A02_26315 [Paraburkholderia acidicola]|uniref:VOC domain-containing protein n=1 Tax=Paraburkholderia acidicola TaxID=1912599 RepID=A0ABV1LUH2_9BURK
MIHHLSISAENPGNVAAVFADIFGGVVVPFPPNPGSLMVFQLDDVGTEIEIHPAGTLLHPDGAGFVVAPPTEGTATHFAISVAASAEKIFEVATRQNWLCRRMDRAQFPLIELWIENHTLCELLPPDFAAAYLEINREFKQRLRAGGQQPTLEKTS